MLSHEPRRSALHRPPPFMEVHTLKQQLWSGSPPDVLDVREDTFYRAGHIEFSINAPDSNTPSLVQKVEKNDRVVLVCEDGRLSSTVARMLGVCGFPDVTYLKGGLHAWTEGGNYHMKTTCSGDERRVHPGGDPDEAGVAGRVLNMLTPPVLLVGIAAAAALLGGLTILMNR